VTGLALAATAYSRALGARLMRAGDAPVAGETTPTDDTPVGLAQAQRQLTVLQWVIPGLTGAALVLNAHGRQQRPQRVASGLLLGLRSRLPLLPWPVRACWSGRAAGASPPAEAGNDPGDQRLGGDATGTEPDAADVRRAALVIGSSTLGGGLWDGTWSRC
jgi:hypothetical protein